VELLKTFSQLHPKPGKNRKAIPSGFWQVSDGLFFQGNFNVETGMARKNIKLFEKR